MAGAALTPDGYDFSGRVAIVTGGGTGIGAATALLLARCGADVVIASRSTVELESRASALRTATNRRCLAVPTDVRDEPQVIRLIQRTIDEFGRIDILVNNAGGSRLGKLAALPTRAWDSSFNLNARAAYLCTREAGRHMLAARRGAIVNVSSTAGMSGVKGGAHYASAKAALQMFTTVTAAEWGRFGVRANCVAAGMIATERGAAAWRTAGLDLSSVQQVIPLGRPGTPEEVAQAIVFLASDAAAYISGQTLAVNGGPSINGIRDE
jgi:citronellol/citronellal dehydrogenase